MDLRIRDFQPDDNEPVVGLSLRAWAPVFESLARVLGDEIFVRLHGDWRLYQSNAVRETVAANGTRVWVAEARATVVGFIAAALDTGRGIGEIQMLAVDPDHQRRGAATALTDRATEWFRSSGIGVAMVETGGDPAHAAARRLYESAGYTAAPVARYFRAL
jgi:ribosomal protein S18 acetylase RimI-like enzyme